MNKKAIYAIVAAAVIIIAAFFIFGSHSAKAPVSTEPNRAVLTVTPLAPSVFLTVPGAGASEIAASTTAPVGSTVKTSGVGRALITGLSHNMVLDYNSQLTLQNEGSGQVSGNLSLGSVWSQVQKVFEQGDFYEIRTGNAVAAVRGTSFGVTYAHGVTSVIVSDGSILLTPLDAKTGAEDSANAVLVASGHKAARDGASDIVTGYVSASDTRTPFYIYNNQAAGAAAPAAQASGQPAQAAPKPVMTPAGTVPANMAPVQQPAAAAGGSVGTGIAAPAPSGLSIKSIDPARMAQGTTEAAVTATGSGFLKVTSIYLGRMSIQDFTIQGDNKLYFGLPEGFPAGTYDVIIKTDSGAQAVLPQSFTVYAN